VTESGEDRTDLFSAAIWALIGKYVRSCFLTILIDHNFMLFLCQLFRESMTSSYAR
jgi:hypothetical protein